MSRWFALVDDGIEVTLERVEAEMLLDVPRLLAEMGDPSSDAGAARLAQPAYPTDPEADEEWRRYAGAELESARRADRSAFELVVDSAAEGPTVMSESEAAAFLRVVNEARLVLGARWGIERAEDYDELRPEAGQVLAHLGWLVEDLSRVMSELMDRD